MRLLNFVAIVAAGFVAIASPTGLNSGASEPTDQTAMTVVVMDPLAGPLSCPCVEGYAQRKYEVLGEFLQEKLGKKVDVVFSESLEGALKKSDGKADLIIGKDSVVRADSKTAGLNVKAICRLTDKEGSTEQYGLIVVNRDDPAKAVADLKDYKIIFGPSEAAEKHDAALALLESAGITKPEELTIDAACSDGACKVIDLGPKSKTAAVISSYAQPLLEGCGTIKKGDLRVVGQTDPVPFITLFVSDSMGAKEVELLTNGLQAVNRDIQVLQALESLVGFKMIKQSVTSAKKK